MNEVIKEKKFWAKLSVPAIFIFLIFLDLFYTYQFYTEQKKKLIASTALELKNIHSLKTTLIGNFLQEKKSDIETVSTGSVRQLLISYNNATFSTKRIFLAALEKNLLDIKKAKNYKFCYILDKKLEKIVAGEGTFCPVIAQDREKIRQMEKIFFSDPHKEEGFYSCDLLAPVKGYMGEILGYLVISLDLQDSLFKIVDWSPQEAKDEETILIKRRGEEVVFLSFTRIEKREPLSLSFPIEKGEMAEVMAVSGKEGFFEGVDYRNEKVLSHLGRIPDTDWFLVTKRDRRKILDTLIYSKTMTILFGLMGLCSIGLAFVTFLLFLRQRLYSRLRQMALTALEAEKIGKVGFWELDHKTGKILWSDGVYHIFGVKKGEFNPTLNSTLDLVHPEDRKKVEEAFLASISEKKEHIVVHRLKNRDVAVLEKCMHFYDKEENVQKSIGSVQDVTREYYAMKKLEESEEKFRLLSESSLTGVYLIVDDNLKYVNKSFADVFEYDVEEMIDKMNLFDLVSEEEKEKIENFAKMGDEMRAKGIRLELIGRTKSGRNKNIVIYQRVIPYEGKDAILGTLLDLTEKKKLEEDLLQAQKMESVGRFAGGIAHDFNNMLQVVISNAEIILSKNNLPLDVKERVEEILSTSMKSANLCRQILAFSRRTPVNPKAVDLNASINSSLKIVKRIIGENISLETNFSQEKLTIMIDPTHLDQIILNLASNSKEAVGENGKIIISTEKCRPSAADQFFKELYGQKEEAEYAAIRFEDNGKGMDRETLNKIFEPFFTTKGIEKGTGLGLSTVYGIVTQNGGFIHPYSEVGKGTVFRIYFPLAKKEEKVEKLQETKVMEKTEGRRITILVCEDETQILNVVKLTLEKNGYKVLAESNPLDAFKKILENKEKIDLLITDMVMPNLSGIELFNKAKEFIPSIKCILMSGYSKEISINPEETLKGVTYLEKPFRTSRLLEAINEALGE